MSTLRTETLEIIFSFFFFVALPRFYCFSFFNIHQKKMINGEKKEREIRRLSLWVRRVLPKISSSSHIRLPWIQLFASWIEPKYLKKQSICWISNQISTHNTNRMFVQRNENQYYLIVVPRVLEYDRCKKEEPWKLPLRTSTR